MFAKNLISSKCEMQNMSKTLGKHNNTLKKKRKSKLALLPFAKSRRTNSSLDPA